VPGTCGELDRVVLLLDDAAAEGVQVLVLDGRIIGKEPGQTCYLKSLIRMFVPL